MSEGEEERKGSRVRSLDIERTRMRSERSAGGDAWRVRRTADPVEPVPPRTM